MSKPLFIAISDIIQIGRCYMNNRLLHIIKGFDINSGKPLLSICVTNPFKYYALDYNTRKHVWLSFRIYL
jgi:hypothetical protein